MKNFLSLVLFASTYLSVECMKIDEFFDTKKPNDVIIITRSTQSNDIDYSPLPAAARVLVYEAVKSFLLSTPIDKDKIHQAEEKEKSDLVTILAPTLKKQEELEKAKSVPKAKISEINGQIAELRHSIPAFFSLYDYYYSAKLSLREQVEQKVPEIQSQVTATPQKIECETLVVFNEMFFGKNSPFPSDYLENELQMLSKELPPLICAHVNLLTYKSFSSGTSPPLHKPLKDTFFESTRFMSYSEYEKKLMIPIALELSNRSIFLSQGNIAQTYFKSSYYNEADDFLKLPGVAYRFGQNADEPPFLFLSTMICYDVTVGARATTTEALVIPSNTLELNDGNTSRIPPNVKVLIHADPRDSRVFLNKYKYLPHEIAVPSELDSGIFSRRFPETANFIRGLEFVIDIEGKINVFRITHWKVLP